MPKSCRCILDRMVFKGAMTKAERDKIVRNLKTQDEGSKTMGKLIDVNAFKARISAGLVYQGADVLEALDEQPAIEERTGKWIDHSEEGYVECPLCGYLTACEGNIEDLHYCFWCGAKMEGAAE